ncbi:hypothetical protein HQ560_04390, partial [bacterium]|nr:hypothetical protein [bacterium]
QLVRTLPVSSDAPRELKWDGLDDDGRPLPAGQYTVKVLSHRGIGQRWVTSLHNAGNPPWRTDDGTGSWGGDHGPPIAAASDAERVYLGWTISEAGWAVVALKKDFTPDGKVQKLWGQHQVLDLGILVTAMDTDGERLFVAQDGQRWGQGSPEKFTAGVVLWNAKDGRPVNFPFGKRVLVVSEWPVSLKEKQGLLHEERDLVGPRTPGLNLMGLAIHGDRLYASLRLENKVVAFDWRTGKRVKEYPIPHPGGLAVGKDGRVLVVSDYSVMEVESGMTRVKWLKAPWDIAFDEAGRLYVTDCGRAMQVKVYEGSKQVAAIGRSGGRPWVGRYDPAGMLMPAGIVVDSKGKVWVTEHDSSPKRVSVWSRDGKLLADLLGPGAYAVEGDVDLARPAWVNTHDTLFDVDYKTGRARTVATLTRPNLTGLQFGHDGGQMGRALRFRHVKGKPYVVHTGRGAIVVYRLRDDLVCEPLAAMGDAGHMKFHLPEATRDALELRADQTIRWVDRNGNGLVELDEVDVEPVPTTFRNYWGPWIGDDLTVWNNRGSEVYRVPVQEWLPTGAPVYPKTSEQKPLFKVLGDQVTYLMPHDDAVYVLEMQGGSIQTGKGSRWSAISRYSLDGKRQWAYRRVWLGFGLEAPLAKPGDVVGAMKFIGTVELASGLTLVGVNGYFGQFNLLSETGLWVASLCKDNRYGPVADSTTVWPENFSGRLFRNRDDGKAYLIAGDTDTRIWEVTGLDGIHTRQASFTLSGTDHQKALAASLRKKGGEAKRAPIPLAKRKVTVDGKLDDWDMNVGVRIDAGGGRGATAALGYDGERLLAAFAVQDKSPMKNAGKDFALLFKSGDTCDVMLATDPKADPKRTKPAAGDLRLLFSVLDGKPVCVLYRPVVKEGAKAPRVLSSPVSAESFDQIAVLRDATVVIRRGENGYSLEAAVPLKTLRFAPAPGALVKGDVGVIFSDPGGSRNVLRAYHANRQTAIVNDIPSEARLTPQDWGWVRVE